MPWRRHHWVPLGRHLSQRACSSASPGLGPGVGSWRSLGCKGDPGKGRVARKDKSQHLHSSREHETPGEATLEAGHQVHRVTDARGLPVPLGGWVRVARKRAANAAHTEGQEAGCGRLVRRDLCDAGSSHRASCPPGPYLHSSPYPPFLLHRLLPQTTACTPDPTSSPQACTSPTQSCPDSSTCHMGAGEEPHPGTSPLSTSPTRS